MSLTCAGYFGGIGSGLLGAQWAGFTPLWNYEPREFINAQTLRHAFPDMAYTPHKSTIPSGRIDLLIGQPDCKQFSNLGTKRKDRGKIHELNFYDIDWFKFLQGVMFHHPNIFILENVPNVKKYFWFEDNRLFFKGFHGGKQHMGKLDNYTVITLDLRADAFGVPQTRKRTYVLGIKTAVLKDRAFSGPDFKKYVEWWTEFYADTNDEDLHYIGLTVERAFKRILPNARNNEPPRHTAERTRRMAELAPGESYYGTQNNRRLFMDRPSGTIASHCSRFVHPLEPRVLTVRETATLMGFPQDFEFFGSETQQLDQVGKAIVPQVAYYLALYLKSKLDEQ